jgi:hypothetical protein
MDVREQLAQLIRMGLRGRIYERIVAEMNKRLIAAGHPPLTVSAFKQWACGLTFPSTKIRQEILGEVIGGESGEAIRRLKAPPFRYWRAGYRKSEENMSIGHNQSKRVFPTVREAHGDDRLVAQAVIVCAQCGARETRVRTGTENDEDAFRKKGWTVHRRNPAGDYCPSCSTKEQPMKEDKPQLKVVPVEAAATVPAEVTIREMSKVDGRLISREVEDHWDMAAERYQPGWGDTALAEHLGVPVEWVREIRERDFGGVGEDMALQEAIARQVRITEGLSAYDADMAVLKKKFADHQAVIVEIRIDIDKLDSKRVSLRQEEHTLSRALEAIQRPFAVKQAG